MKTFSQRKGAFFSRHQKGLAVSLKGEGFFADTPGEVYRPWQNKYKPAAGYRRR